MVSLVGIRHGATICVSPRGETNEGDSCSDGDGRFGKDVCFAGGTDGEKTNSRVKYRLMIFLKEKDKK